MSAMPTEIAQVLAGYAAAHRARPVAVYPGARKFTQLILGVARGTTPPTLRTDAGRPLAYRNPELLRNKVGLDTLRIP